MNKFEKMDFEGEDLGRRSEPKKTGRTLDSDKVSPEDIIIDSSHNENLNPEDIFMLKEEGRLHTIDSSPANEKISMSEVESEPDSFTGVLELKNNKPGDEETSSTKEVNEVISSVKEEALSKERASITSKKNDNDYYFKVNQSNGKRGKEHKSKFKKGLESIKRILKIK